MEATPNAYPATLAFDPPERIANWRPVVQWLLAIPHFMVLYALRTVVEVLAVISWFIIVFTGRLPDGIAKVQAMYLRYQARVIAVRRLPPGGISAVQLRHQLAGSR